MKILKLPPQQLFWFATLPILYLTTGIVLSLPYSTIHFLSTALLYLFALSNLLIEMALGDAFINNMPLRKKQILFQEFVILVCLLYFILQYAFYTPILLICYSLMVQGKYIFKFYDLDSFALALTVLFKAILLNAVGFYLQANFISINSFQHFLPLLFPLLIVEIYTWNRTLRKVIEAVCWSLGYLLAILLQWPITNWFSLLMLLSAPLVLLPNERLSPIKKAIIFNLNYLIILVVAYFM
ncbi:hypothetical protein [Marinilactibacillus kalidii]|uniref:hypothetical protein n=1 Tax=Marinilactibacillus kalidii TaxID=2820274 RepID=UPI001ABE3453|nr:hypothetical protein [Marinilactibacillus kalidii]